MFCCSYHFNLIYNPLTSRIIFTASFVRPSLRIHIASRRLTYTNTLRSLPATNKYKTEKKLGWLASYYKTSSILTWHCMTRLHLYVGNQAMRPAQMKSTDVPSQEVPSSWRTNLVLMLPLLSFIMSREYIRNSYIFFTKMGIFIGSKKSGILMKYILFCDVK